MRVNVELRSYQLHISDISKKNFDVSLQLLKEKLLWRVSTLMYDTNIMRVNVELRSYQFYISEIFI